MIKNRKKILVSAYAVSPDRGSECAVGWEITTRLAKFFDVTVLMCDVTPAGAKYFDEVQKFLKNKNLLSEIKFIPISVPASAKKYIKLHDSGFWPAYYWAYKCWQKEAFRVAKKLHLEQKFDLAYQLNMVGFREPGFLWKIEIPFLWGPTNGFHSIPFSFLKSFKGKEFFFQAIKHLSNNIQIKLASRPKKAARIAELVWCVDETAQDNLEQWGAKTELMQETGLSLIPRNSERIKYYDGKRKLNIVWSGMITPGKSLDILLKAMLEVKNLNFELIILGDGILRNQMEQLAKPISNKIVWCGWVDKEIAVNKVKNSDILIHTSLKEGTPHSILEAIGMGVPVVCHDTCGMKHIVNDFNGFKIPYKNRNVSINYLITLLKKIQVEPDILNSRFETTWSTAETLKWDYKVNKMRSTIDKILK